jgi:argininosuccinate synthase
VEGCCKRGNERMRFQVLSAASMKMYVFWLVAPCSLVEVFRRFNQSLARSLLIVLTMEAASTFKMSVNLYQTTRRNNPEDCHLRGDEPSGFIKGMEFLDQLRTLQHGAT